MSDQIKKVVSAAEAAGFDEEQTNSLVRNAQSDHDFFGTEGLFQAENRAKEAVEAIGIENLGINAQLSIEAELSRYFMS